MGDLNDFFYASQGLYAVVAFVAWIFSILQLASEFALKKLLMRTGATPSVGSGGVGLGRVVRSMHRIQLAILTLCVIKSVDLYGSLGYWNHHGINQFLASNITALLIVAAAGYVWVVIDSIFSIFRTKPPRVVFILLVVSTLAIFIMSNVTAAIATALDRSWPSYLNLLIAGPGLLVMATILYYASWKLRRTVMDLSSPDDNIEEALRKMKRTQYMGCTLAISAAILNLVFGAIGVNNRSETLRDNLTASSDTVQFWPYDYLQLSAVLVLLWYSWQPLYVCHRSPPPAALHDSSNASSRSSRLASPLLKSEM